jgi:hypothetical protein
MQEHQDIPGPVCVVYQEKRAASSADILRPNLKLTGSPGVSAGDILIPDREGEVLFAFHKGSMDPVVLAP